MANVLFKLSGSIAAYKACYLISRLVQEGHAVQAVVTPSALQFIGPATLEGLTRRPVQSDNFALGHQLQHIDLTKWADVVILCPATANTINKLAGGIGDDLLSTLFLAHDFKKPYLIAPAMNTKMYLHPATQESLKKLRSWGVEILETASGVLACGDEGEGKLLDPDLIYESLAKHFRSAVDNPLDILITSGGTRERIDDVRSITNISSGETGKIIAQSFLDLGHRVTFVHGLGSQVPVTGEKISYTDFRDLDRLLKYLLTKKKFDAVIHAAAVSDYSVDHVEVEGKKLKPQKKVDSTKKLAVVLKNNPKLLPNLKSYSKNKKITVVGFKLTVDATAVERREAIQRVSDGTDLVVHNDLTEINGEKHKASLVAKGKTVAQVNSKVELGQQLVEFVTGRDL